MIRKVAVVVALLAALGLTTASAVYGADASVSQDAKVVAPASQPATMTGDTPDPVPGTKPPATVEDGIETGQTLWQAIKDKAWWLVAACGVFLAMLILQLTGLFKKMGKRATWIVAGALSFLAALFLAFDKNGFSWNAFLAFATAGPTVAWLRGFVKKAILNFKKEE